MSGRVESTYLKLFACQVGSADATRPDPTREVRPDPREPWFFGQCGARVAPHPAFKISGVEGVSVNGGSVFSGRLVHEARPHPALYRTLWMVSSSHAAWSGVLLYLRPAPLARLRGLVGTGPSHLLWVSPPPPAAAATAAAAAAAAALGVFIYGGY